MPVYGSESLDIDYLVDSADRLAEHSKNAVEWHGRTLPVWLVLGSGVALTTTAASMIQAQSAGIEITNKFPLWLFLAALFLGILARTCSYIRALYLNSYINSYRINIRLAHKKYLNQEIDEYELSDKTKSLITSLQQRKVCIWPKMLRRGSHVLIFVGFLTFGIGIAFAIGTLSGISADNSLDKAPSIKVNIGNL